VTNSKRKTNRLCWRLDDEEKTALPERLEVAYEIKIFELLD
jgi:hypothetical protein